MIKFCFIMRGMPGSGKSTTAIQLAGSNGAIHSTDDYFMENGKYTFSWRNLQDNHNKNMEAFKESLVKQLPVVVCDNTNLKTEHYASYAEVAKKYGYHVCIVEQLFDLDIAAKRNTKGLPKERIRQMVNQFEPFDPFSFADEMKHFQNGHSFFDRRFVPGLFEDNIKVQAQVGIKGVTIDRQNYRKGCQAQTSCTKIKAQNGIKKIKSRASRK